ncbi:esterase FE4 [Anabrus simplex]|uniref:esterase FE4 n=1 Tax=Anabrus simplex TaxID=316456 RepID=UPI0035A37507
MVVTVTVDVVQGTLRGKETTSSVTGKTFYSFCGVPFAKPPIGPLRFKDAKPPEPWTGVRDAMTEGQMCTQLSVMENVFAGSEDCLYLNVYTPQLPKSDAASPLLPVVFLIHGGGFVGGSGNSDFHGPDFLVGEGLVVVSPSYRVGVLGFLSVDGPACPGNMGLKDQVAALRWTQQNVAKFGGDPNNVTIMGASAGAASVHYHLLSPMSKGLFHQAAGSSGAVLNPWALTPEPRYMAFRLGEVLGCTTKDPDELVEYLRTVDHIELIKAATKDILPDFEKERLFPCIFTPTLEVEVEGIERFLPAPPLQLLEEGHFNAVPTITGIAMEECAALIPFLDLTNPEIIAKIDCLFDKIILPDLRLPEKCNAGKVISKLRHFYFKDKPINKETFPGLVTMLSDITFATGANFTVKKLAQHGKAPVYQYLFALDGKLSGKTLFKTDYPGATHADDFVHFVVSKFLDPVVPPDSPEAITRARLLKMYSDFAKTGNPTPEVSDLVPVIWKPHTASNPCYLNIDKELSLKTNLFEDRMTFWEEIYKSESN